MSDQNVKGRSKAELSPLQNKPKYESPILVPLGEMAKASGACAAGSAVPIDCSAGPNADRDCTQGDSATRDCTAGLSATGTTCSAGGGL